MIQWLRKWAMIDGKGAGAMLKIVFENNESEVLKELERKTNVGLEAIGLIGEGYAKDDCPVDTGRLRNSISHATQNGEAYIGTNVEYAQEVELNDRIKHVTGRAHFLRDAAATHGEEYKDKMREALEE